MKASDTVIQENHLPKLEGFSDTGDNPDARMESRGSISMTLDSVVEKAEKEHIAKVMKECGNNKTKAAKHLNISLRSLYYKLERYGLE